MVTQDEQSGIQTAEAGGKGPSPPYISFVTFRNMVEWLETEEIPLRFDRSFWQTKYSGATGFQLMAGLRFLGLLEGDRPQPALECLVQAKGDERKAELERILRQAYAAVNFDELARATPSMVSEWFRKYPLEGDTLRKAESFFVNACKDTNITLSNAVRKKARNKPPKSGVGIGRDKKLARGRKGKLTLPDEEPGRSSDQLKQAIQIGRGQGNQAKVVLDSGGEVTLNLAVDLFHLSEKDREFVLGLVDLVRSYQRAEQGTDSEEVSSN